MTLNNLAILYRDTQRLQEAEEAYQEALMTYRQLAKANAAAYLPNVATILNNLAILYRQTQRLQEAEEAYQEEVLTHLSPAGEGERRGLPAQCRHDPEQPLGQPLWPDPAAARGRGGLPGSAYDPPPAGEGERRGLPAQCRHDPEQPGHPLWPDPAAARGRGGLPGSAYDPPPAGEGERRGPTLPNVAMTLNNLAILYGQTQRLQEAEEAHQEALMTYRQLAKVNAAAYLPDVATTLNNLGNLYGQTQRLQEAEEAYQEALMIRRQLAKANAAAYPCPMSPRP